MLGYETTGTWLKSGPRRRRYRINNEEVRRTGARPFCRLSQRWLNPIKTAYNPIQAGWSPRFTTGAFNEVSIDQNDSTASNRVYYYYAELALSLL